jgi:hypothetical protein
MERIFHKLGRYFCSGWRLAVLDMQKGRWIVEPTAANIDYLRAENANGRHILMQPMDASRYLPADDLSWALICRHHRHADGAWKPGRMVVETSPHNYQVWIHSQRPLSLMEKRYWLKRLMSDPGADPNNRWGRCPGFRNRKDKHRDAYNRYPLARLIWIDWMREARIPQTSLELPEPHSKLFSHQPQRGSVCRYTKELCRSDFDRGNESATDFSYALALARGNYTENQIRCRILSERTCWKNHQGDRKTSHYLDRTIKRAKAMVAKT